VGWSYSTCYLKKCLGGGALTCHTLTPTTSCAVAEGGGGGRLRSEEWFGKRDKDGFNHRSWMKNQVPYHPPPPQAFAHHGG
jgi:hypothetical protein